MVYYGVIAADDLTRFVWPDVWAQYWQPVERDLKAYLKICSFAEYFTQDVINQLLHVFETEDELNVWLQSTDIIPTFLISENLPEHPEHAGYTRTATAAEMPAINFKQNQLTIKLEIRTFNPEGVEQKQLFSQVELIANNLTRIPIDAAGNTIGEYDALISQLNSGVSLESIIRQSIQQRGGEGWIDRKLGLL